LRTLDRLQPLALLVLRLVLGVIMIVHGYPKVTGFSHFHSMISGMGLPGWLAYLSAAAEFLGGMLIVLGLFTRCAAFAILIDLGVAIWKVHWKVGFRGNEGYEFPLAVAAIAFALIFFGGGPMSLDSIRRGGGGGSARKSKY